MKKHITRFLLCLFLLVGLSSSKIPVKAMGIPHEILVYLEEHGMDWLNIDDLRRASLATGISSGTGEPLTPEDRRQIEASLGISSSPAASGGQASKSAPAASKHEHVYQEEVTKEATCTEVGEKTFTCECGDSYTEEIEAPGHAYTDAVTKEPGCTEEGGEDVYLQQMWGFLCGSGAGGGA